ncbi:hypothetical protein [Streptomyces sp. NBC_00328]|uniref:hypothetical protein n=1 Tax=Streptomyces sp. NBC_00328 TaxID=2903646 RepID=UPI002E2BFDF9|nr:hypothetical protein [Streptomyces sp. NBC_00328]
MSFFALYDAEHFYGGPEPVPGARVSFVPDKLFAARERRPVRPADRQPVGDEGLLVNEIAADVLQWPSSLWRVTDLEPMRPIPSPRWMHCRAFTVVEQVPAWLVAGPHGDAVEWVIARTRTLTGAQADALAALSDEGEEPLTRTLWSRWSRGHHTLSPVGCALTTLYKVVNEAAHRVGPQLFGPDEEYHEVEVLSDPAWLRAFRAAYAAALALGAPELLSPGENAVLARRWTTVFGSPDLPQR